MGPLDAEKKDGTAKVGNVFAARTDDGKEDKTVFELKSRSGFGGGFKIQEEYRAKLQSRKKQKRVDSRDSDDDKDKDEQVITKDEILAHLNLTGAEAAASGKYR